MLLTVDFCVIHRFIFRTLDGQFDTKTVQTRLCIIDVLQLKRPVVFVDTSIISFLFFTFFLVPVIYKSTINSMVKYCYDLLAKTPKTHFWPLDH